MTVAVRQTLRRHFAVEGCGLPWLPPKGESTTGALKGFGAAGGWPTAAQQRPIGRGLLTRRASAQWHSSGDGHRYTQTAKNSPGVGFYLPEENSAGVVLFVREERVDELQHKICSMQLPRRSNNHNQKRQASVRAPTHCSTHLHVLLVDRGEHRILLAQCLDLLLRHLRASTRCNMESPSFDPLRARARVGFTVPTLAVHQIDTILRAAVRAAAACSAVTRESG